MDTGTGIAIAGVWLFAAVATSSADTSEWGKWLSLVIAGALTFIFYTGA